MELTNKEISLLVGLKKQKERAIEDFVKSTGMPVGSNFYEMSVPVMEDEVKLLEKIIVAVSNPPPPARCIDTQGPKQ